MVETTLIRKRCINDLRFKAFSQFTHQLSSMNYETNVTYIMENMIKMKVVRTHVPHVHTYACMLTGEPNFRDDKYE